MAEVVTAEVTTTAVDTGSWAARRPRPLQRRWPLFTSASSRTKSMLYAYQLSAQESGAALKGGGWGGGDGEEGGGVFLRSSSRQSDPYRSVLSP